MASDSLLFDRGHYAPGRNPLFPEMNVGIRSGAIYCVENAFY